MRTPLIGMLPDIETVVDGELVMRRTYMNNGYIDAVLKSGGNPVILPFVDDEAILWESIQNLDGLIITGGRDVDPYTYREEPLLGLGNFCPERDLHDLRAIRKAVDFGLPIFGICRGMHILNVAFGGSLFQDIPTTTDSRLKHRHQTRGDIGVHTVRFVTGSRMERIFGSETRTNSYHHAAIKVLASGFEATGFASDGIIEAIESRDHNLVYGVQWHPEMMFVSTSSQLDLFRLVVHRS